MKAVSNLLKFLASAKIMLVAMSITFTGSFAIAQPQNSCPVGDFKACGAMLKSLHAINQSSQFASKFDEVCSTNKKFKCVKKIVRGEVADELKYLVKENKKAHLFPVKIDAEDFIYIFEPK